MKTAKGDEELQHLLLAVDPAQQQRLDGPADDDADEDRGEEEQRKREPGRQTHPGRGQHRARGHIGADRIEGAVRHVQHAKHAEDERQPDRDEEDQRAVGQAVEPGEKDHLRRHVGSATELPCPIRARGLGRAAVPAWDAGSPERRRRRGSVRHPARASVAGVAPSNGKGQRQ
jgi:hypothetical protein